MSVEFGTGKFAVAVEKYVEFDGRTGLKIEAAFAPAATEEISVM